MHPHLRTLSTDLQRTFGSRLLSVVAYGNGDEDGAHTLALVERLSFDDLAALAPLARGWRKAGVAVPLVLSRDEFRRTLDVFPVEYGRIIAHHEVILGENPFTGMQVSDADLRRACELQAKSHLIHLREGYIESQGQPQAVAGLIAASAAPLRSLVANLERLDPGIDGRAGLTPELMREVELAESSSIAEPSALFSRYLAAVERLWHEVDRWRP